jgi:polysaccharide transporter, PST family
MMTPETDIGPRRFGDAVRLVRNLGVLILGEIVSKVVAIFVFGRLGSVLGDARYGELEFAFAAVTVASLVADAGLVVFGARAVAKDQVAAKSLLPAFLVLRAALVAASVFTIGFLAVFQVGAAPAILLGYGLALLPVPLVCDWIFQGRDEMAVITASNLLRQSCLLVGVLVFVQGPDDAWCVPVSDAVGLAAAAGLQQFLARRRTGSLVWEGVMRRAVDIAKQAAPIGFGTIAWAVRFWAPMVIVGSAADGAFAGHYGAAHRLAVAMHQVVFLYFFNLLPTWSRDAVGSGDGISDALRVAVRKSFAITCAGACAIVAGTWLLADPVIRFLGYGPGFEASSNILIGLCFVPAIAFVSGNVRFGLIAAGHAKGDAWANAAGAACVVVGCFVFGETVASAVVPAFVTAELVTALVAFGVWLKIGRAARVSA